METIDLATLAPPDILAGEAPPQEPPAPPPEEAEPPETTSMTEGEEPEGREGDAAEAQEQPRPADLNKRVSDFLKVMKDTDGANADVIKAIRKAYFEHGAYSELGKLDNLRGLKQQLESLGGFETIAQLQEVASSVENTDALLDRGDPQVLDQIFEDAKEGAIKLAPYYLDRVAKESPEAYQRAILPHFIKSLESANFPAVMDLLLRNTADNPDAQQVVKDIQQWFTGQKQLADGFRTDSLSPERDTLKRERQELTEERERIFQAAIAPNLVERIGRALSPALTEYRAALDALPERAKRDFASAVYQELQKLADADPSYKNTVNAMIASKRREASSVVNFIGSKVDMVAAKVVATVAREYGLKKGGVPAKAAASGRPARPVRSNADNPAKIEGKPDGKDVDWSKTSNVEFLTRRAWLKNGAFVQW